jgi:LemA protein
MGIGIVVIIVIVIVAWWIVTSNNFVRAGIKVHESLSGVEVALTKRFDMLTKLRDVARQYAAHELAVFTDVVAMRKGMSVTELNAAAAQADTLGARINALAESYPQLRSNEVFAQYQAGIVNVEEHLQAARRLYNSNVTRFNTMLGVFPSSLVGSAKHLEPHLFFEAEAHKQTDITGARLGCGGRCVRR